MNMTSTEFRPSLTVACLSASLSAQYRARVYGANLLQHPRRESKVTPVDKSMLRYMREAWKKRRMDQQTTRLLKVASSKLTTAGQKKRDEDKKERKQKIAKRRRLLEGLIPGIEKRRRTLANLPLISTVIAELPTEKDDEQDATSTIDVPLPKSNFLSKQKDIRDFFK
jgi:citrate synthase